MENSTTYDFSKIYKSGITSFEIQNSKSSPEILSMYIERMNYSGFTWIVFEEKPFSKLIEADNFIEGFRFLLNNEAFVVPLDLSCLYPFHYTLGERQIFFKFIADEKNMDLEIFLVALDVFSKKGPSVKGNIPENFDTFLNIEKVQRKDVFLDLPQYFIFFEMTQKFEDVYKILSTAKIISRKELPYTSMK